MSVRAKCFCNSVQKNEDGSGSIGLSPVTSGSAENESFFKATPSGRIELTTVNQAALAQFEQGKEYYVDFSPAEAK